LVCCVRYTRSQMFRLSMLETDGRRKLVLEGKLIPPWTQEVESAWRQAKQQLEGRKLIIDLTNVTLIGSDGENTLLNLMRDGAKFTGCGVLTKHLLRQLARRCRCQP
jgi:ABC-type transporter Mla MlaB component